MTNFSWKLDAPQNAPAWYDQRSCLIRTTPENRTDLIRAFVSKDASALPHAPELLHELAHYVQDVCTGWGFYQSELIAAIAVAHLTTSASVAKNCLGSFALDHIPLNDSVYRLTGIKPQELFASAYSELGALENLWKTFFNRSYKLTDRCEIFELDIIESHALAVQLIPYVFSKNAAAINALLDGDKLTNPYIKALSVTAIVFGCEEGYKGLHDLLLVLALHITLCELAFSVPPPSKSIQPVGTTAGELSEVMPEALSKRFCRILESAASELQPAADKIRLPNNRSLEGLKNIISRARDYSKWLRSVEVCVGRELAEKWMHSIQSPASYHGKRVTWISDPQRLFRKWAMEYWRPFADSAGFAFTPEAQFMGLMSRTPAFRVSDGLETEWTINAAQMELRDHVAPDSGLSNWDEAFDRVSAYLNRQAVVYELAEYILTGSEFALPCPYRKQCAVATAPCDRSVAKGFVKDCRAFAQLKPVF